MWDSFYELVITSQNVLLSVNDSGDETGFEQDKWDLILIQINVKEAISFH